MNTDDLNRKTTTDENWNRRAVSIQDHERVNLEDVYQRDLEFMYIRPHLRQDMRLLEVGCGNGFTTRELRPHVAHVDAFDYAENMIASAHAVVKEENNRFFVDNVLAPRHLDGPYDAVLCVRVLINLKDLAEQRLALRNLTPMVKPGGLLILAEGFTEGFAALSELRAKVGLPPIQPAKINFYASIDELRDLWEDAFTLESEFHIGAYDYLTRVYYPMVVGADQAVHNTVFSEKAWQLARAFNPEGFAGLSRLRGLVLRKKA